MNDKIGIVITTFLREELLVKSLESLLQNKPDNCEVIILNQGNAGVELVHYISGHVLGSNYYMLPFNCGLSYARNFGVLKAKELGCEYVFLSSDSFLFNESFKKINDTIPLLDTYGLVGFDLLNSTCRWEGKLNLIEGESFEIDFADPKDTKLVNNIDVLECECMRNCFLAKTDTLLNNKWDEDLLLGEHESFMYELKLAGFLNCWTKYISLEKMTDRPVEYLKYRKTNFKAGIINVLKKYNLKTWITYKNHRFCNIQT